MATIQIADLAGLKSGCVIFYNNRDVSDQDLRVAVAGMIKERKLSNVRGIPVDDVSAPLMHIADEEAMNAAGWYRKEK